MKISKMATYFVALTLIPLLGGCFPGHAWGQTTTGSIYGTVADKGGAVLPNATVTATSVDTDKATTVQTNANGEYVFQALEPGNYKVSSQVAGFKLETQTGFALSSNQNLHAIFSMTVGSQAESVEVEAGTTLVDTRESQIAETIEQKKIENLPLNGRTAYDLISLIPGVTSYIADSPIGSRAGALISVNGLPTQPGSSSYYLDGAYDTTFLTGGGNPMPNPDAIQEFRVLTSNFDAEFGRTPGAAVNVITRSGTSQYHGMAYEYLRNNIFNAKNYFASSVTSLKQNQFGGNFGGRLPFAPKDKAFIFLSYEKLVSHTPVIITSQQIVTATALERMGNFSASTVKPNLPAGTQCGTPAAPVICPAALDPVAQNLLAFVPVENADHSGTTQQNANGNVLNNQGLARIDYQLNQAHQLEGLFFTTRGTQNQPNVGVNQIFSYAGMLNYEDTVNTVLVDTWTISPNAVNSVRAFYTQNRYQIANQYQHYLPTLGSQAPEGGIVSAMPLFAITGYWTMGTNSSGPSDIDQQYVGLIDTLNLTRGKHQIKAGGAFVFNKYAETGGGTSNGIFSFTGSTTGSALADFVLGKANSLSQSTIIKHRTHNFDPSLFAQDDWQVTRKLNINMGLRWEVFGVFTGDNNYGTFIGGRQSTVFPSAPIGLLYQGDPGIPLGIYNTPYDKFAPRIGFAYDIFGNGQTSLRGGFGVFYSQQGENILSNQLQQPYNLSVTVNKTANLVCPYGGSAPSCPAGTPAGTDPFPFVFNPAAPRFVSGATILAAPANGGTIPYVEEYSLTLEQQLSKNWTMHIAYVGNSARHFYISHDENAPAYTPGAATTTAGINARRPYEPTPATFTYGAINLQDPSDNFSYNGLQTTIRGHIRKNLDVSAFYVWSKALGYQPTTAAPAVPVAGAQISTDRGLSPTDIRNNFVMSVLYEFPQVHFLGAVGDKALSGWKINTVTQLESGTPFTVISGVDTNLDGVLNDRATIVGNPYGSGTSRAQRIKGFLNPAAFAVPTGPYGNEQNDSIIGPRNTYTNASLLKEFPIHDRLNLQFRAEAFNAFNNVNLILDNVNAPTVVSLTTLNNEARTGANQIGTAASPRILQFALKMIF